MFSSSAAVVAMRCGHYIHRVCYDAYMQTSYKCPICSRSAVNMELQWRKMDLCLESQPMPDNYRDTNVWVTCNDCTMRSCVPFHWLGNKCRLCDSYNTNQIKIVNGPGQHENEHVETQTEEWRAVQAVEEAQANGAIPNGLAPDLLPSVVPAGRVRQQSAPSRVPGLVPHVQSNPPISPELYAPSPAAHISAPLSRPMRNLPLPTETSDLEHEVGDRDVTAQPSQPLPISARNRSNIDIARMTSVANASTSASAVASSNDEDSATSDAESEDSTTFWGSGLSPPNINLMPNGWASPRLFSTSPTTAPEDEDADSHVPSSWGIPGTWRLNSPNIFSSASDANATATATDFDVGDLGDASGVFPISWHPSQWRLGSPHDYFFGPSTVPAHAVDDRTDDEVTAVASDSPPSASGWDPRQWSLGSPRFFSSSAATVNDTNVDATAAGEPASWRLSGISETAAQSAGGGARSAGDEGINIGDEKIEAERGLFNLNIRPTRFLAERWGTFSSGGGVPIPWRDEGEHSRAQVVVDDDGNDNESSQAVSGSESDLESEQKDGTEDREDDEEDELDLIGHR